MDKQQFFELFLNKTILQRDIDQAQDQKFMPPNIEEIAQIFEFLDEDRSGMIKGQDFMSFLKTAELLKISNVDLKKYKECEANDPP